MQVAHPRHRAGACTLNAVGLLPVSRAWRCEGRPPLLHHLMCVETFTLPYLVQESVLLAGIAFSLPTPSPGMRRPSTLPSPCDKRRVGGGTLGFWKLFCEFKAAVGERNPETQTPFRYAICVTESAAAAQRLAASIAARHGRVSGGWAAVAARGGESEALGVLEGERARRSGVDDPRGDAAQPDGRESLRRLVALDGARHRRRLALWVLVGNAARRNHHLVR